MTIDWDEQPLGQMSDAELGRKLGVSREAVRQQRARKNISKHTNYPKVKVGNRYGRLIVVKENVGSVKAGILHECLCDCGITCTVTTHNLNYKFNKSCGCLKNGLQKHRVKDIVGMKFGRLKVLSMSDKRVGKKIAWICECDCGNIKSVIGSNLKRGFVKSCGCLKKELDKRRTRDATFEGNTSGD